jgi:hypothetical protein
MFGRNSDASSSQPTYRAVMKIAWVMAILIGPLSTQQKAVGVQLAVSVNTEPPDPALVQVPEDPHLPRVLIVGDSISMGYTWEVRKLLAGKANVQHPDVNCGPTEFGVQHIHQWIGEKHWDVVYFNFGLHDLKYLDAEGRYVTAGQRHAGCFDQAIPGEPEEDCRNAERNRRQAHLCHNNSRAQRRHRARSGGRDSVQLSGHRSRAGNGG